MVFSSEFLEPSFFAKYEKLIELMLSSPHNLSSIKEFERAMTVHIEDTIIPFEGSSLSGRCIDIGSGGGIPGLVLAISFPKSNWTLLESIAKKTREIERFARDLDLTNVAVKTARAEEFAKEAGETFDSAFLRAVGRCDISLELAAPLVKVGGYIYLYKGPGWLDEKVFSDAAERVLGLRLSYEKEYRLSDGSKRFMVVYEKERATPSEFPRRSGVASKLPLGGRK